MLLFTQRQPWRKRLPYAQRHDWRKIFPLGIRAILRQSLHDHCASDSGHHVYRFTEERLDSMVEMCRYRGKVQRKRMKSARLQWK